MTNPLTPFARVIPNLIAAVLVAITLSSGPIGATEFPTPKTYELAQSRPGGGRPPREAMQACENKSAGDDCSFTIQDGSTAKGTCRSPSADVPAACMPAGGAPKG